MGRVQHRTKLKRTDPTQQLPEEAGPTTLALPSSFTGDKRKLEIRIASAHIDSISISDSTTQHRDIAVEVWANEAGVDTQHLSLRSLSIQLPTATLRAPFAVTAINASAAVVVRGVKAANITVNSIALGPTVLIGCECETLALHSKHLAPHTGVYLLSSVVSQHLDITTFRNNISIRGLRAFPLEYERLSKAPTVADAKESALVIKSEAGRIDIARTHANKSIQVASLSTNHIALEQVNCTAGVDIVQDHNRATAHVVGDIGVVNCVLRSLYVNTSNESTEASVNVVGSQLGTAEILSDGASVHLTNLAVSRKCHVHTEASGRIDLQGLTAGQGAQHPPIQGEIALSTVNGAITINQPEQLDTSLPAGLEPARVASSDKDFSTNLPTRIESTHGSAKIHSVSSSAPVTIALHGSDPSHTLLLQEASLATLDISTATQNVNVEQTKISANATIVAGTTDMRMNCGHTTAALELVDSDKPKSIQVESRQGDAFVAYSGWAADSMNVNSVVLAQRAGRVTGVPHDAHLTSSVRPLSVSVAANHFF